MMNQIVLVPGTSSRHIAQRVAEYLDVSLVNPGLIKFSNGELSCQIEQNVRGRDVFIIQSLSMPVNDNLMELLILIDALKRASADSITAVIPHYGYARQDRKVAPRTPITAKLVADLITVAGATRVITMDLHSGQIQGFFNIPFDNIFASPVILDYVQKEFENRSIVCVSPDAGGVERVRFYAKKLHSDLAMVDKRRPSKNVAIAMNIVGDVQGKDCLIFDDMIDTAGTLIEACKALKSRGAEKIYAFATHGIFSGQAIEKINSCDELEKVIVTDTITHPEWDEDHSQSSKILVLKTAEIFAKAIYRTSHHESVSSLFS